MPRSYVLAAEAQKDLFEIWDRIAADSVELADRIHAEFHALFDSLGRMPTQGHVRRDLTDKPVLFFPMYSFLVIYRPEIDPILIVAVLRGKREVGKALGTRG